MIRTLHPEGKKNFKISVEKYDTVKRVILRYLKLKELTHTELLRCVEESLASGFDGSISWYMGVVKLDLEARGEIMIVPGSKPQRLAISPSR